MNAHRKADSSQDATNKLYVCQTVSKDGLINNSIRHTNNTVYFTKTPYVQHKNKSKKGLNGSSKVKKDNLELALYTFAFDKCWTNVEQTNRSNECWTKSWTNDTSELQYNLSSERVSSDQILNLVKLEKIAGNPRWAFKRFIMPQQRHG